MADASLVTDALDPELNAGSLVRSKKSLLDGLFAHFFKNLVYPQIWEDPEVDIEALALKPGSEIVTIASGGCNILNYLTAEDIKISAVDINETHVALNRLKLAALKNLPSHEAFFRYFGYADEKANAEAYKTYIKPHLDEQSRKYWEGRTLVGNRRISMFQRNFYRFGLLGRYIGLVHLIAFLHGKNPKRLLEAQTSAEQLWLYENTLGSVFKSPVVRWLCNLPVSLYGLGIPPAQFEALRGASQTGHMADVLDERLKHLACDYEIASNYFAWQAFGRRYDTKNRKAIPRYLEERHYQNLKKRAANVSIQHANFGQHLATRDDASLDGFVLLDAQDWMSDAQLTDLWQEIQRTAKPGARVIFRTAGTESILPGRVPEEILSKWRYLEGRSPGWHARDRSSIYGGFHAYEKQEN